MSASVKRISDELDARAKAAGFSGAVRVCVGGTLGWEAAYGFADRAHGITNTAATRFAIASGTKLFTALAVGALIDDGKLELDASLRDVVPSPLPNVSPGVTIRHLIGHTSGVYDYYDEELVDDFDTFELTVPPFKLRRLADYMPMLVAGDAKFPPGARFSYSNGGYVLLGLAIEAVSGMSYADFVTERVLRANGMTESGYFELDRLPGDVARGYVDTSDGGWHTNVYLLPIIGGPDGGAFSTVRDMERLWVSLLGGQVLSPALTGLYLRRSAQWKDHIFYGYGLWLHDDGAAGSPRYYIEGCDAGVSFKSTAYGTDTIATVMSNSTEGAWSMADAIDELLCANGDPGSGQPGPAGIDRPA